MGESRSVTEHMHKIKPHTVHVPMYQVDVVVYTHSIASMSLDDCILAAHLDRIPINYSPKFIKEHPEITAGLPLSSGKCE